MMNKEVCEFTYFFLVFPMVDSILTKKLKKEGFS